MVCLANHCYCNRFYHLLNEKAWWEGMKRLKIFAYCTVAVVHFTDQNWIPKTVCCIRRFVMVCKIGFTNWNAEIALLRASMVVTYYIKFFQTGADRHNDISMSLLLLVGETIVCFPIASFLNYLIYYNRIFGIIKHDVGCYWFEFLRDVYESIINFTMSLHIQYYIYYYSVKCKPSSCKVS